MAIKALFDSHWKSWTNCFEILIIKGVNVMYDSIWIEIDIEVLIFVRLLQTCTNEHMFRFRTKKSDFFICWEFYLRLFVTSFCWGGFRSLLQWFSTRFVLQMFLSLVVLDLFVEPCQILVLILIEVLLLLLVVVLIILI